jgi:hypothetical protein
MRRCDEAIDHPSSSFVAAVGELRATWRLTAPPSCSIGVLRVILIIWLSLFGFGKVAPVTPRLRRRGVTRAPACRGEAFARMKVDAPTRRPLANVGARMQCHVHETCARFLEGLRAVLVEAAEIEGLDAGVDADLELHAVDVEAVLLVEERSVVSIEVSHLDGVRRVGIGGQVPVLTGNSIHWREE